MVKVQIDRQKFEVALAKRNLSASSFARELGISRAYMSQLVTGTRHPSPRTRQRLQDALGLEFDDLFYIINSNGLG